MQGLASRLFGHLIVPVGAFLFIGVPLETYIRGMDGLISTRADAQTLIREHLFLEAAACFYCITALLEGVIILTRPHIRSRPGIPVTPAIWVSVILGVILAAAYIYIRMHHQTGDLRVGAVTTLLWVMIAITTVIFGGVHFADFLASSEVAPRPKARRAIGK